MALLPASDAAWGAALYLGLVTTALTSFLQVPPENGSKRAPENGSKRARAPTRRAGRMSCDWADATHELLLARTPPRALNDKLNDLKTYIENHDSRPQTIGQRTIAAESAAIIYALDPVYAAGFSYALLGEQLGPAGFAGGGLLVAAAVGTQLWNRRAADAEDVEDAE